MYYYADWLPVARVKFPLNQRYFLYLKDPNKPYTLDIYLGFKGFGSRVPFVFSKHIPWK